jgi:hypothetical protein
LPHSSVLYPQSISYSLYHLLLKQQFHCLSLLHWCHGSTTDNKDCGTPTHIVTIHIIIIWTWYFDCVCAFWISLLRSHEIKAWCKCSVGSLGHSKKYNDPKM